VLKKLCGRMCSGELVALMGESGSGKSTLLNAIGGRAEYGTLSGGFYLNRQPFEPDNVRHLFGFVPQEYILFEELTVFENLQYAAVLRAPLSMKAGEQLRIEATIQLLGLQKVRDFVLSRTLGKARLSGGQLRRVGIGAELVCNPLMLLLDEPTSALDTVNARIVVGILKDLSNAGMAIACSIHQPPLGIYSMFTHLSLMQRGQCVFSGACPDAVTHYQAYGFDLPDRVNPADFFIEVNCGFVKDRAYNDFDLNAMEGAQRGAWDKACAAEAAEAAARESRGGTVSLADVQEFLAGSPRYNFVVRDPPNPHVATELLKRATEAAAGREPSWVHVHDAIKNWRLPASTLPGFFTQLRSCIVRYVLKIFRFRRRVYKSLFANAFLGILVGILQGPDLAGADPTKPIAQRVLNALLYITMGNAIFIVLSAIGGVTTVQQGHGPEYFMHEASSGVRPIAEILARFLVDLGALLVYPFCFVHPWHSMSNMPPESSDRLYGIFVMTMFAAMPLGYLLGVLLPSGSATPTCAMVALLSAVFTSGNMGLTYAQGGVVAGFLDAMPWFQSLQASIVSLTVDMPFSDARNGLEMIAVMKGFLPHTKFPGGASSVGGPSPAPSSLPAGENITSLLNQLQESQSTDTPMPSSCTSIAGVRRLQASTSPADALVNGEMASILSWMAYPDSTRTRDQAMFCFGEVNEYAHPDATADERQCALDLFAEQYDSQVSPFDWSAKAMVTLFWVGLVLYVLAALRFVVSYQYRGGLAGMRQAMRRKLASYCAPKKSRGVSRWSIQATTATMTATTAAAESTVAKDDETLEEPSNSYA